MITKATVTILSVLLAASLLVLIINSKPTSATPTTRQVLPGESIQAAINNANTGDVILVEAGTYQENVVVNKSVTLRGIGRNVTIIQAKVNWKAVIEIGINNVNVSGFTIQGGSIGIEIFGYNASRISDNKIVSNDDGIWLSSSHNNIIFSNVISLSRLDGVFLEGSANNLIYENVVTHNTDAGIGLSIANRNEISNNTISFNYWGIWFEASSRGAFDGNTFLSNTYGVSMGNSINNVFFHSNFINNTYQVETLSAVNFWNTTDKGNYWSDYIKRYPNAIELDASGIWNTTYVIDADTNQIDYFPLVNAWNPPKDVTPPLTTDNYDGLWHTQNFSINLTAVDDLSGVKETYYIQNGALQISNISANGQPHITTENSNNTIEYWSIDKAGNSETHHLLTNIKLDKTFQQGSIQINNGATYTTSLLVTLSLSATDVTSGVTKMRFSNDGTTWSAWEPYATSKSWNLTLVDGVKTVYVLYEDNAGLTSEVYNSTIVLDTAPPLVSFLSPNMGAEIKSKNVTINWTGTDLGSGVDHYELTLDTGSPISVGTQQTYTFSGLNEGNHTVYVNAFDRIGQSSKASVSFIVDTTPIGGVGYFEEAALIVIVAFVIGTVALILLIRRKRRLNRKIQIAL